MVDLEARRKVVKKNKEDYNNMLNYFEEDLLKYEKDHVELFKEYFKNHSSYVKRNIGISRNEVDTYKIFGTLYDFYKDRGDYNKFVSALQKNENIFYTDDELNSHAEYIAFNDKFYGTDVFIYPTNDEGVIMSLAHEIEHAKEMIDLADGSHEKNFKYFSFGPMKEVFPRLREKEMALYLLKNGYNRDNVLSAIDLSFSSDMVGMEDFYKSYKYKFSLNNLINHKGVLEAKLDDVSYGYGEILSSTILELCDGDFELSRELQDELIGVRGPGYSSELLNTIGCDKEDLIKNGGKVFKKIHNK